MWTVLADEAQCPECGFWDLSHPDVRRALKGQPVLERYAACRCPEVAKKQAGEKAMMVRQANLPARGRSFADFQVRDVSSRRALEAAREFAEGGEATTLVLVGPPGSGKTHLLEAIGRRVLERGLSARYDVAAEMMDRLRHCYTHREDLEDVFELMRWYQAKGVLLLDDVGLEKATDWVVERLTVLIDERQRMRWRTAIATNLSRDELAEALGDRLASRLFGRDDVARVTLTCSDYRRGHEGFNQI